MVRFRITKRLKFFNELPKNKVGKVLKYKLKETHKDLYRSKE